VLSSFVLLGLILWTLAEISAATFEACVVSKILERLKVSIQIEPCRERAQLNDTKFSLTGFPVTLQLLKSMT